MQKLTIFLNIFPVYVFFMLCNSLDIKAAKLFKFFTHIHSFQYEEICLSYISGEEKQFPFHFDWC